MTFISRRDLLKRAAIVGSFANLAGSAEAIESAAHLALQTAAREPLETLTATEADLLDLIVARLIPTDANGPGATEARAVRYIDRALGGALASSRQAYTSGLSALDQYCRTSRGTPFAGLSAAGQDGVLTDVETGAATGFPGGSALFFTLVLNHTMQGTFGDPHYGGNANFVGWDLIGYPGVRTLVTPAEQQRLERNDLPSNRKSGYDYNNFTKGSARTGSHDGMTHGD